MNLLVIVLLVTQKSVGFIIGRNPSSGKWQFGKYEVWSSGVSTGGGIGLALDLTWSGNPCIKDVEGNALTAGGDFGLFGVEANIPIPNSNEKQSFESYKPTPSPSYTGSFSSVFGSPVGGHAFYTYTDVYVY
jgi:hypothetical protein